MKTLYLTRNQVPGHLLRGYNGTKIRLEICESVHIPADAGTWSGGTRQLFSAVRLSDGHGLSIADTFSPPWDASRVNKVVTLRPGFAILETGTFCGKDNGLRFYILPVDAAPMLPAPAAPLSTTERKVLEIIGSLRSFARADEYRREGLDPIDVMSAKEGLLRLGLIDSRGAITVAGRNARKSY